MRLDHLVEGLDARLAGDGAVEITDLAYDSRRVAPGGLFFCVPGSSVDGHEFAPGAVRAGAAALVCERPLGLGVPEIVVADARAAMAPMAARFWGDPSADLRVVGITGTNGKTTTAFLVRELLEAQGVGCGLLGTVKAVVGGVESEAIRTTPEAIDVQRVLREMADGGDAACAMEVSSHALVLHRTESTRFAVAIFTNLTQDHLDFHPDMEAYFAAKRTLFEGDVGVRVVNLDDEYGRRLAAEFECTTYSATGRPEADLRAERVEFDAGGSRFELDGTALRTRLPGAFNVANALAALATARALGIGDGEARAALAAAPPPPGRFEPVDEGQPFTVLVDYAHTPDSLENVLRAARGLTGGRLIAVFGAGGDRDRGKRPLMGRAGAALADLTVVTSDNPRSEDPDAIVAEVAAGAVGGGEVEVEPDRRAAIRRAFAAAAAGDCVVIAGKGHEQGQEFAAGRKLPFDDREVAREELHGLGAAA